MDGFQILDSRRYPWEPREEVIILPYYRWEHRATIGWNTREFAVFVDHGIDEDTPAQVYIEEIIGGHLETVKDDSLHDALAKFAYEHDFLEVSVPIPRSMYP